MNPAPAEIFRFLTVTVNPFGAPFNDASSEKLYCVFATQIGHLSNPSFVSCSACFFASVSYTHLDVYKRQIGGRGDQYVTLNVRIPRNLTARQKELLSAFQESLSGQSSPTSEESKA